MLRDKNRQDYDDLTNTREIDGALKTVKMAVDNVRALDGDAREIIKNLNANLQSLETQADEFCRRAEQTDDPEKKAELKKYAVMCDREPDILCLSFDIKVKGEATKVAIKEETNRNTKVTFEKFKEWAKK